MEVAKIAKPIINKIIPFDAAQDYTLSMSYIGNMPYRNRVIIYDAKTLSIVYDHTTSGNHSLLSLEHIIPANTLTNGRKYAVQGQVMDSSGAESALSDKSYFWTASTPLFYFQNINEGDTVTTASLYAELVYDQPEWEDIAEFRFQLYDEVQRLLTESEIFYTTDTMNYAFRGFENETFYQIRAVGMTVNGIALDTGYIKIYVKYKNPSDFSNIYAKCNANNSVVTYETNFTVINPSQSDIPGYDDQYKYNNSFINLIGKTLVYDRDFIIDGDFTMSIRGTNMYRNTTILKCSNANYGFTVSSYIYDDRRMRYKLTVPNGICSYILYSDPVMPDASDIVTVHIRRINHIYQLVCFVDTEYEEKHNMWWGDRRPTNSSLALYDIWIQNGETGVTRVDKDHVTVFYMPDQPEYLAENKYDIWIGDEQI